MWPKIGGSKPSALYSSICRESGGCDISSRQLHIVWHKYSRRDQHEAPGAMWLLTCRNVFGKCSSARRTCEIFIVASSTATQKLYTGCPFERRMTKSPSVLVFQVTSPRIASWTVISWSCGEECVQAGTNVLLVSAALQHTHALQRTFAGRSANTARQGADLGRPEAVAEGRASVLGSLHLLIAGLVPLAPASRGVQTRSARDARGQVGCVAGWDRQPRPCRHL